MTPAQSHVLAAAFEERIQTLVDHRRWFRTRPSVLLRPYFDEIEKEYRIELRALLRLRRQVRKAQRAVEYHASFAYDLGQAVMEEDAGMDREGLPEFNGSFR